MPGTARWFTKGLKHALTDLNLDPTIGTPLAFKAMILNSAPDLNVNEFRSDVSANETSGTGYTAGGKTISGFTIGLSADGSKVVINCNSVSWPSSHFTGRYLVIYVNTGSAGTSTLMWLIDPGAPLTSGNSDGTVLGTWQFTVDSAGFATATPS